MIDPTKICVIAIENKLKNKTLTTRNFLAFKEVSSSLGYKTAQKKVQVLENWKTRPKNKHKKQYFY